MQLSDRVLAKRYAQALYLSAAEAKEADAVGAELGKIYRPVLDKMAAFKHPGISAAEKKALLGKILGPSGSKRLARFLELLVEKKRFGLFPYLASDFNAINDDRRGVVNATVRSAGELSKKDAEALGAQLGKFCGKKVNLEVKTAPELLAGVIVRMGDWVFDGSLRGRLQRMKRELAADAR